MIFGFQVNWSCFTNIAIFLWESKAKTDKKYDILQGSQFAVTLLFFWRSHLLVTGEILSHHCLLRLFLRLCYICRVIVFSLRVQNSESFCWPSWSMQSWHATGQADLPSLRWGNNRASFITAIKSWCSYEQLKPDKILLCHNLWMVNPYVVLGVSGTPNLKTVRSVSKDHVIICCVFVK